MVCMQQLLTPKQENLYLMEMLSGSTDFETPQPRFSIIELPGSDIQREGTLKKLKTNKKKYFVLRSTSSSGPARLEYYDSEKKLRLGQPPKRSLKLHTCFNINKKNDTRQKYAIALYTKDECFSVLADDAVEQELWLNLLLKLQNEFIPAGEMPKPHYDHVWQVSVKPKGLGASKTICGDYRLCLSESEICMIKKNSDRPEFTFQLSNIRKYGNTESFFFIEVGRHSPTGPGEIIMQLEDSFCAQNIHEQMLIYMRKSASGGEHFRQRSSTSTSTLRRNRESMDPESQVTAARQRTLSESKKHSNLARRSNTSRPQSVSNLSPDANFSNLPNSPGFYANIPSTFTMPRDRSDSSSSRASSHRSLTADDGYSPEPVYENTKEVSGNSSLRSMTPESLTTPITEESLSTYMDMSPSQTSAAIMGDAPYLSMSPGQAKPVALTSVQHARSSSLPVTTQNSVGHESSNKPYLAMSPGQVTPETNESSSYMAMLPGQHSNSMTTLPSQQGHSHSIPYSPPSQRASRPETPPSQRTSRPGSSCSHDSSVNSSEGYMEMNPAENSRSSEKVGPEQGYIDMTVGSSSSTSSKDGSPKLSRTAPIPIRSTKQSGYLEMGPSSQPLAPVKEGGSGEGYLPMTPQTNPYGDVELRPNKVVSYLSDDSMSGEFPKRAYSVGSRPPRKLIPQHVHHAVNKQNVSTNGRSSSAPHLIEKKLRSMIPYTQMDSSLSCSPSQSIKSSISDSDSFIEMECMRPRTSSDSFGCRPRSSSFGRGFGGVQGHRPRSSSYGTSARGKLGSYESVRLTSKELHLKHSNESLTGQISGASSSESLKKNEIHSKINKKSEYVDMRLDKSESPGYIDMTCNPKSMGSKSSTSSLASSPAIQSTNRPDATSSPSIKIIKPSGTQKSIGFSTINSSTDSIPPQSSLFSPINFVSPSGSRSPSVKGRSPASSGRESEEESYIPFQPASSEKDKKTEHKKEKKMFHAKSKHKDKDRKHGHKSTDNLGYRVPDGLPGINIQEMKSDRDSMYMDFEPGALDLAAPGMPGSPQFSTGPEMVTTNQSTAGAVSVDTSVQKSPADTSSYVEYEPEGPVPKSSEICTDQQDSSPYMQYEPGIVEQTDRTVPIKTCVQMGTGPPVPPRKSDVEKGEMTRTETESEGSSVETLKDIGSASHVESDPYMDFDPEKETQKSSIIQTPTRVRSFITDTSMEEELGKEIPEKTDTTEKNMSVDERSNFNESTSGDKTVITRPSLPSSIGETDEYVGLDFKSTERFLLGGNVPSCKNLSHEQLVSSKNVVCSSGEDIKSENIEKTENKAKMLVEAKTRNCRDVFKSNVSSLEELKIEDNSLTDKVDKSRKSSSSSYKISPSPKELTKQGSLPCMNLPAEILELQIKETDEKVNYERENSQNSQTSRHSCSDLTVSYEPMNFPSDTLNSSELSGSQQQVNTTPGLNYASLDLGSHESIDCDKTVKSRHASIADDSGPLPPNSYAQIDFNKSEILKNSGKQDKQDTKFPD